MTILIKWTELTIVIPTVTINVISNNGWYWALARGGLYHNLYNSIDCVKYCSKTVPVTKKLKVVLHLADNVVRFLQQVGWVIIGPRRNQVSPMLPTILGQITF